VRYVTDSGQTLNARSKTKAGGWSTRQQGGKNMQSSSGIKDKVVVITGASSGIGEATALLLAERGAKVVLGARGANRLKT